MGKTTKLLTLCNVSLAAKCLVCWFWSCGTVGVQFDLGATTGQDILAVHWANLPMTGILGTLELIQHPFHEADWQAHLWHIPLLSCPVGLFWDSAAHTDLGVLSVLALLYSQPKGLLEEQSKSLSRFPMNRTQSLVPQLQTNRPVTRAVTCLDRHLSVVFLFFVSFQREIHRPSRKIVRTR